MSALPERSAEFGRQTTDFGRQITPVPVRSTAFARQTSPWEAGALNDLEDYIFSGRFGSQTNNDKKGDVEEAAVCAESSQSSQASESTFSEDGDERLSLWTRRTIGLPLGGFFLAFLNATVTGVAYGFFLGYMGLDSNVMMSITALMKLPQVLLLPFGMMNDCLPICGLNRKPYFLASWLICACALLIMSLWTLPGPYYCQHPDGSYDTLSPPCNPTIHAEKNWYIFPMFVLVAGVQMGCVAGEGLLLQYSQCEPLESRGKMKAEFTMVTMAGSLASSAVIGVFMNSKEYLGTFDWGISFNGLMMVCFVISAMLLLICMVSVYEPRKVERPSFRAHMDSSWNLIQSKCLSGVLIFAFVFQFFAGLSTTAAPMVRSQWAGVRVLQQQLFQMAGMFVMMAATWVYKVYLLQSCWRKAILIATVAVTVCDSLPTFLAIFDVVRDQYFYLGEEIVGAVPTTALALILNLMVIELSEPGQEGLTYGLVGTVMHSSQPLSVAVSNQVSSLFQPSLSKPENYQRDEDSFRRTVALSYALTYLCSMLGALALPLIPRQKQDAQARKGKGRNRCMTALVILIPALCLPYGITVLLLTSQPQTACLRFVGGPGCA
ncbi:unnamed protein product [Symbiodinium natans]|uniref:Transmembrane protein n=1 Tax=Symbiodinium natans TaxID=878477 RepID=A0A812ND55_9DINO|nr:unnamed protein product [Symbiodinium natans]